jgi:cytochrome c-type biogenesis protein CcmH
MNIAWIAFTLMVVVAAVGITIPLVRRYDARRAPPVEGEALRRQLADIDGQAAAESLPNDVTEGLRTETVRRFLAETPVADTPARAIGGKGLIALGLGLAAVVAIGGTLLYSKIGRPDMTAAPAAPAGQSADAAATGHVAGMISELEAKMRQSPNDPEGWRMLGWSYMQTNRPADAAGAYGRAAALNPANADYKSAQGEALVKAADGRVTPEAEAAFAAAFKLDPTDPRARYFLAAAKDQRGDHDGALADWTALLKSAPAGAPWAPEVRDFVVRIEASRGVDVSSKLPAVAAPPADAQAAAGDTSGAGAGAAGGAGGPSPDQVAAIQQMSPAQQKAMIGNMVEGLAARLKANPNDAEGWVNLMRARMVLNDPNAAAGAYHDAMRAFAGAPSQRDMVSEAAKQLNVPGA